MRIFSLCLLLVCFSTSASSLSELSIAQLQKQLKSKAISLQDIANHYLNRIEQYDDAGPKINSVVQISPTLSTQIQQLQTRINNKEPLGKAFGTFILLKDNIGTNDGMANTAGSWLLRNHKPKTNAFLVDRLVSQDAIILGKANLSEWANFRSTMSSSGWSSLYGQTRNPYDPTRSTCGSSSGSGAAIAADFATVAIGTETDGSVTCPSAINGIVGIKPTLGLISRSGIIPLSSSQDTAGPMARTVTDAVVILEAMMGKDSEDNASLAPIALRKHLITDGLKGKKIGLVTNMTGYHPGLDELFFQQKALLEKAGAIVKEVELTNNGEFSADEYAVLLADFKTDINHYFKQQGTEVRSLEHAIELNNKNAEKVMPVFGQEIFISAQQTDGVEGEDYQQARANAKRLAGKEGIDKTLTDNKLDLLIAPTVHPAWKIDHVNGDHYLGAASSPAAVAGYPHITVPMGFVADLPVGMSFFAGHLDEAVLVEAAFAYEQISKARKPPKLEK